LLIVTATGLRSLAYASQPQPLRLERDGTATGKRIVYPWQRRDLSGTDGLGDLVVGQAFCRRPAQAVPRPTPPDFAAGALEYLLVGGVLPYDQVFDDAEQPLAFALLRCLGWKQLRPGRWVVDHLGKEHGAGSGQRSPRPPEVQRRGVAVADRLFAGASGVDSIEGQGYLNQFLARWCGVHAGSSPRVNSSAKS
jgi:hypothetical protein